MAKHDWVALLQEFESNPEKYPTAKSFADSKGINQSQQRKAFKVIKERVQNGGARKTDKEVQKSANLDRGPRKNKEYQIDNKNKGNDQEGGKSAKECKGSTIAHNVRDDIHPRKELYCQSIVAGKSKLQSARDAGYPDPRVAYLIHKHSDVQGEIARSREELRIAVGVTNKDMATRLAMIAFSSSDQIIEMVNGKPTFKDGLDLSENGAGLAISKIKMKSKETPGEFGIAEETEYEFSGPDTLKAFDMLDKMLGASDPLTYNSFSSGNPIAVKIWTQFSNGEITAQDARNYYEYYGETPPPSIVDQAKAEAKLMAEENEGNEIEGLDYDSLEAKAEKYKIEHAKQKETFLPDRKKELVKIRKEHEDKNVNSKDIKE